MFEDRALTNERVTLFRSDSLLVRADLGRGSRVCFVVFDPMVEDRSLERIAFAERFLAGHGLDAIHVLSARNGWYQDPALPGVLAQIKALTGRYERVVTYGSSMGGYAALRFAAAVGAKAAIAISPQYSMLRSAARFETRWAEERAGVRWLHERPGDRLPHIDEAVVFYDDRWIDGRHAESIRRDLPHMTGVALPYAGHPVSTLLADVGVIAETIVEAAHGRLDRGALLAAVRRHRHRSAQFLLTLARRQPVWRLRLKARLAQRACDLAPDEQNVLSYAGLAHECAGQQERALALHAAATRKPSAGFTDLRRARALWRAGRRAEAREVYERARQCLWHFNVLHEHAARLAIVDGAYAEGIRRLIEIAVAPGKKHRSVLARTVGLLRGTPLMRSDLFRTCVRGVAAAQIGSSVLNPANILRELAEADND